MRLDSLRADRRSVRGGQSVFRGSYDAERAALRPRVVADTSHWLTERFDHIAAARRPAYL
jgi:hypothetical protein